MSKQQRWFTPLEREAYRRRVELERQATALIRAADSRRRRVDAPKPRRSEPLQNHNGWIQGLGNLRRAMREQS